ncbi:MAG: ATP synthase F1 subunit gamma [Cytophagales bacterium]|nr:ATP synthase F1 subunit gamma [Cytophagales bacterium]MDW8383917.1 ATP synthase F1 subunit gamma [Flammeovirgaceae bacterium]
MPSLKEVKNRINSVTSTQQITKAMKMVAAAKLRRAQERILLMRPYAKKLSEILQNVSATLSSEGENPYGEIKEIKKVLIVVITSDRGLCGAFNSSVIKSVQSLISEKYSKQLKDGQIELLCIGAKGFDYFKKKNFFVISQYKDIFQKLSFDAVRQAAEFAMNNFLNGNYDVVEIVYNEFKNVATQIVKVQQFLPILPQAGTTHQNVYTEYIFEPSKEEILSELIPKSLKIEFYKAVLESNASEHGARMTAMDKATDNAKELLRQLRLSYNRTRQDAITKEILEIVGGANALTQQQW